MTHFKKPVLVVGSRGMLGTDLYAALERSRRHCKGLDLPEIDITDSRSTSKIIQEIKPCVVINTAAMTDVDGCESNREKAHEVNALGALNVARAARESEAYLIHISTDYVFDGAKDSPYKEEDPVNPLGIYGKTKAEGEKLMLSLSYKNILIVRTQWLYGLNGKNFVESILRACSERNVLRVVDDQHGRPTFTEDLADALLRLIDLKPTGILNVANSGSTSWHGFATAIVEIEGLKNISVEKMATTELERPAPRPLYSLLSLEKFQSVTGSLLRDWESSLSEYLTKRKFIKG